MYKLLIADDHPLFREAIADVIRNRFPQAELFEAQDLLSCLSIAEQHDELDMVLLDLKMPGMDGLNGLLQLRNQSPTIPVVIVSAEEDKSTILQAMTYGAVGFIIKSLPRAEMSDALEQVIEGQVYLPSDVIRTDVAAPIISSTPETEEMVSTEQLRSLTRKQLLVLERMNQGESNKQIAYHLNIAETTVKAHVSAVLRKLNVHNRIQAVLCTGSVNFDELIKR
ncbi:response regulator transcription factor [Motiliproteus sp. MSK22-1]|uniref:response regulator n=1 Tax=Motiliproteus sp. MSK22-1 TaxID=1897630 RepID=UPI0009783A9E|nr:response regulator transcription factor [Motiliproteus sp. MSK22-1]OMH29461.1 DNA-binding response regulator [Motiliproteus sp. MSK22-1]